MLRTCLITLVLLACACHRDAGSTSDRAPPGARSTHPAVAPGVDAAPVDAAKECRSGFVGGWRGDKDCLAGRSRWGDAPSRDLVCATDADCVHIEAATCFHLAVRREVEAHYRALMPCPHPAAGACARVQARAACKAGCCTVVAERRGGADAGPGR